jgi:hypothetical protein
VSAQFIASLGHTEAAAALVAGSIVDFSSIFRAFFLIDYI